MKTIFAFITLFAVQLWAQTTSTIAATSTTIPQIISGIQDAANKIPAVSPAWAILGVAIIFKLIVRIYPTAQPQSVTKWIAVGLAAMSGLFMKLSVLLDGLVQVQEKPDSK